MTAGGTPLRSAAPAAEPEEFDQPTAPESDTLPTEAEAEQEAAAPPTPPVVRPRPTLKLSTTIILCLGVLGFVMLIEPDTRNQIASSLGVSALHPGPLYFLIGFGSAHLLATMAAAGAIEMAITALAYNYTTDWVKAAKIQKWSGAFRKVQMEAIRSGKKNRIAVLRPYQERLTRLSSEVTIAQFKGMAITYFLLILIYTWIGLTIAAASVAQQTVNLGGSAINLYTFHVAGYFPLWFFIFSLYTIPASMIFRRVLKEYWVRHYAESHQIQPRRPAPPAAS